MSKHTPGPWTLGLKQHGDEDRSIKATMPNGNPKWIARVYGDGYAAPRSVEHEANAKLIAAAPEMAEALRELLETAIPFGYRDDDPIQLAKDKARAVLAKAGL